MKAVRVAIISKAYLERCVEDGKETKEINVWNMSEDGKSAVCWWVDTSKIDLWVQKVHYTKCSIK